MCKCQVSGVRCQCEGARCQVSGVRCQVSDARCKVSGARCQVSLGGHTCLSVHGDECHFSVYLHVHISLHCMQLYELITLNYIDAYQSCAASAGAAFSSLGRRTWPRGRGLGGSSWGIRSHTAGAQRPTPLGPPPWPSPRRTLGERRGREGRESKSENRGKTLDR